MIEDAGLKDTYLKQELMSQVSKVTEGIEERRAVETIQDALEKLK